jgi:hypothetical protein
MADGFESGREAASSGKTRSADSQSWKVTFAVAFANAGRTLQSTTVTPRISMSAETASLDLVVAPVVGDDFCLRSTHSKFRSDGNSNSCFLCFLENLYAASHIPPVAK